MIASKMVSFSGTDFCALGNDCHENATCLNLATRYTCQCKRGFFGNGTLCEGNTKANNNTNFVILKINDIKY